MVERINTSSSIVAPLLTIRVSNGTLPHAAGNIKLTPVSFDWTIQ